MIREKRRNNISIFFVLIFLFLGMVKIHAYTHFGEHDEQSHCELCVVMVSADNFKAALDGGFEEEHLNTYVTSQTITLHFPGVSYHYSITLPEQIHNKPPPIHKA